MSLLAVLYISSKQDFGWMQDRYWQELCFIFFCFCLLLALIDKLLKKGKKGGGHGREFFMNFILHPVKHRIVTYVVIELCVAFFCPSMFTYFIHFLFESIKWLKGWMKQQTYFLPCRSVPWACKERHLRYWALTQFLPFCLSLMCNQNPYISVLRMKQIWLQRCGQSEERRKTAAGRGHRWSFFPDLFYFTVNDNPRYLAGYSNY